MICFLTPRQHRDRTFDEPAALQEHPDIEARVGFDVGHAGVVMVVTQTETANHECETKARQGCRSRAAGPGLPNRTHNLHVPRALHPMRQPRDDAPTHFLRQERAQEQINGPRGT